MVEHFSDIFRREMQETQRQLLSQRHSLQDQLSKMTYENAGLESETAYADNHTSDADRRGRL